MVVKNPGSGSWALCAISKHLEANCETVLKAERAVNF